MNDFRPLPEAMIERAREFRGPPATPRVAATVVLLRPAPGGFEVYALRRLAAMVFGGVYAFPGGSVDPTDGVDPTGGPGDLHPDWARRLGLPAGQAAAVVGAAVREVFEETGVLLADGGHNIGEPDRLALLRRETTLPEILTRHRARLRDDLLAPWSRWITPEFESRRFDTYFFVVALPNSQQPVDVSGEADRTVWITPADALAGYADGTLSMLPPTVTVLRELAGYRRVADAVAASAGRDVTRPIVPRIELAADGSAAFRVD